MNPSNASQDLEMKLYHHPLSGNPHRARLFVSLLGLPHDLVEVDLKAGAHKSPEFLKLNPFGQVPVVDDEGVVIADSNAILVYLTQEGGAHRLAAGRSRWCRRRSAVALGGSRRGGV